MITVTEIRHLDGTGDIVKDVEYPKFDGYNLISGGDLILWRSDSDPMKPYQETVQYVKGSFVKVAYKK